jgi:hypothetical protein
MKNIVLLHFDFSVHHLNNFLIISFLNQLEILWFVRNLKAKSYLSQATFKIFRMPSFVLLIFKETL